MGDVVSIPGSGRPIYLSREWHAMQAAAAAAAAAAPVVKTTNARRTRKPSSASYLKKQYRDEAKAIVEWLDQQAAAGRIRALGWHVLRLDDLLRNYRGRLLSGRLRSIAAVWVKGRGWRRTPSRSGLWAAPTTPALSTVGARKLYRHAANRDGSSLAQALEKLTTARPRPAAGPKKLSGTRLEAALLRFWTESAEIWVRRTSALDGRIGGPIERPAQNNERTGGPSPGP